MKLMTPIKSLLLVLLLALSATNGNAAPVGTGFLYQGLLTVDGRPASGSYDMIFTLFRQGEPAPGTALTIPDVSVMLGVFTVKLDYGQGVFDGIAAYELGIAVRESAGGGDFTSLGPRQRLTPTPFAISAQTASSVPDSALSSNVPLLNGSPVFSSGISVTMLRVADASGAGVLRFGPTDDCSIGVDPQGPAGLLLRDPRGVRILSPDPAFPPRLLFGPTDDCSIGIDPNFPGLVERDPVGFRLMGRNNQGCRLIFGPTMDCTVEVDPMGPAGLLLRDPRGIRIIPRESPTLARLLFGPTDDCSIGIDPAFPGLIERDPIGFRLMGQNNEGRRLIFGPTMDCTVEVDPMGPAGLLLRDPRGIRILPRDSAELPRLLFGPTDDCSIGIDPAFPGLIERDPVGFRLLGQNNQGGRLIFGPTMNCTVEVDPAGPQGLLLRDPRGIRILPPGGTTGGTGLPRLIFGPTDDCSIGIDPQMTGLLLRDPRGVRIAPTDATAPPRLLFGPTDDCSIGIDPVITGLVLRDPRGVRIAPANSMVPSRLLFGPTDDCSIGIDPAFPGLIERDPVGFRLLGQNNQGGRLIFGPTMDCTVEVNPAGPQGLLLRDPRGIRILPAAPMAPPRLLFGPTDDCSIGIDPQMTGLLLRDPRGVRIAPADAAAPPRLLFGPTDDCSIGIDPTGQLPGLIERDPIGFRLLGQNDQGSRLIFGPTMDCTVEVDPAGPQGLLLRDPRGIRILPPGGGTPGGTATARLLFGPTDDCSIGVDPTGRLPGLIERDPVGLRLLSQDDQGGRLIFGPTMNCTIEVRPSGSNSIAGLILRDPSGIRLLNPEPTGPNRILFGPTDDCNIAAPAPNGGMCFSDPRGFTFKSQVTVNGPVFAQAFVPTSSRRFKSEVKPIEQPLEKISKLQGVRFTWSKEKGGRNDIGFIAEEVAKVIPEVVAWEEDGKNARGVNYDHLVAVAVEGIKAQQSQIQTLEREKAELKQSLETMQAQLDRLTRQMQTLIVR